MKKRVYWKKEEIQTIAKRLLEKGVYRTDEGLIYTINNAINESLPTDRRRILYSHRELVPVLDELDIQRTLSRNHPGPGIEIKEVKVSQIPPSIPKENLFSSVDGILKLIAQDLVDRLIGHVEGALTESLQSRVIPSLQTFVENYGNVVPKVKRTRILIVGLKPQQAGMMVNEFPGMDLRFVDSGKEPQSVDGKLGHTDVVIAMTNFISHSIEDHLKKHPNYIRVSGGMDKLRETLKTYVTTGVGPGGD